MTRTRGPWRTALLGLSALVALTATACGDGQGARDREPTSARTNAAASSDGDGDWLLRFTTAGGADGERSRAVFVTFNPTTGTASSRALPPSTAGDASMDEQVLLVSADHAWAVTDTGIPRAQQRTGRLVIHSTTSEATQVLDIRAATGEPRLRPTAWAFDPTAAEVIRVVDADLGVWKVDLTTKKATRETTLQPRAGWIYANGFDKLTGEPYVESIDSDETEPAGNGDGDVRPVERDGGTLIRFDGTALEGLPQPPCGFAGGFAFDDGPAWLFCADTPNITAYQAHPDGSRWHAFGTPSAKVVPPGAVELTFVLPPVS